jgi:hypothetical protein
MPRPGADGGKADNASQLSLKALPIAASKGVRVSQRIRFEVTN